MKLAFLMLIALPLVFAVNNAVIHPLTTETIAANHMMSTLHYQDTGLRNPYAKDFYHRYYMRPQDGQKLRIINMEKRVADLQDEMKKSYPFRGNSPLDPNVYNYIINKGHNDRQNEELNAAITEMNEIKNRKPAMQYPQTPATLVAQLQSTMKNMRNTLRQTKLDREHDHVYPGAFESDKMKNLVGSVKEMEKQVRRPLEPTPPNPEELAALNSLAEKMETISQRLHQRSRDALVEHAKSQALMLERLVSMMRRMANAISTDRRSAFLNAIHLLIHRYHLHDHPFLIGFEREIAHSIATGLPLQLPEDLYEAEMTKQHQQLGDKAMDTKLPKDIAQEMKDYGRKMTARGKELDHRATMAQRRQIPFEQRDELQQHLRQRLNSPATEVHPIGAARPLF